MISVIIPVYNVEKYLESCVKSVMNQSYTDLEILLIDDGSSDKSGRMCDELSMVDSRIKTIHKKNGGLSSARNVGINKATGEWIIFIDSDDYWDDYDTLQKLIDYATVFQCDIVRFDYKNIDEHSKLIKHDIKKKSHLSNRQLSNYEMVTQAISNEWFAVLFLIRRSIIDNFFFDENCKFQEDIDFFSKLFANKEIINGYLQMDSYIYRKHLNTLTSTYVTSKYKSSLDFITKFSVLSERITDKKLRMYYLHFSAMMYFWTIASLLEIKDATLRSEYIKGLNLNYYRNKALKSFRLSGNLINKYSILTLLPPRMSINLIKTYTQLHD